MKKYLTLAFFCLITFAVAAQTRKIDSLKAIIANPKTPDTTKAVLMNTLSYKFALRGDTTTAHNYAKEAMALSKKHEFDKGQISAYYNTAYFYQLLFKKDVAEKNYLTGINLAKEKNLPMSVAYGYQLYAVFLKLDRQFKRALEMNQQALTAYLSINDKIHVAVIYTNMGNCYSNMKLPEQAIQYHLKSLKMQQELGDPDGIATAYNNIGVVYERMGNFEKALENTLRMLPAAKASGLLINEAAANGNIGAQYQNLKQHAKAIPYILTAIELCKKLGEKARIALNYNNLAASYNDLKQYDKAYKASIDCFPVAREADDTESEAYAYITAGTALAGLKNYAKAERYMDTANIKAHEVGGSILLMNYYEQSANVYKKIGKYQKAIENTDKMIALKDSTYNAEKHAQIAALQEQYDSQRKDKQLAENALADLNNKAEIGKKNRILIGLGASIAVLLAIAFLILRNMRLKSRKLESEKALAAAEAEQGLLNEKLRISSELHDNIGSQLTFIHSSIQNIRAHEGGGDQTVLQEAEEIAVKTIRDLRQTVWFINNTTFTADDFAIRLREYVKPYLSIGSTAMEIVNTVPAEVKLSSASATHLFRIVQEAINNAIKYANASLISVDMHPTEGGGGITVIVSDNGTGFDTTLPSAGFGIRSMEVRADKAGGRLTVFSALGKGTSVKVNIPVE